MAKADNQFLRAEKARDKAMSFDFKNADHTLDKLGKKPARRPRFLLVDNEESVIRVWQDTLATHATLSEYAEFYLFLLLEPSQTSSIKNIHAGGIADLINIIRQHVDNDASFDGFFIDGNLGGGAAGLNGIDVIECLRKEIPKIRFSPFALVTVSLENNEFRMQAADSELVRYMPKFVNGDAALLPRMILEFEEMRAQARQAAWIAVNQNVARLLENDASAEEAGNVAKEFLREYMGIESVYFRDGEAGELHAYVLEDGFDAGPDVRLEKLPPFYQNFARRSSDAKADPWLNIAALDEISVGQNWVKLMQGYRAMLARTGDPFDRGGVYSVYSSPEQPAFRKFEGPSLHHLAAQLSNRRMRERDATKGRRRQQHLTELLRAFTRPQASKDVGAPLAKFLYEEFGQRIGARAKATVRRFERGSGNLIRIGGPVGNLEAHQPLERISVNDPKSTYARVARGMKPIMYSNVDKHNDEFIYTNDRVKSSLTVPLAFDGVCFGAANIESDRYDAFSAEDRDLACKLAESAAAAIARHRSLRFLAEASEFLDAIVEAPQGTDAGTLLGRSAEILYRFCGFSDLVIVLPPAEEREPWSVSQVFHADYERDRIVGGNDALLQKWRDWVRSRWENTHLYRALCETGDLIFTKAPQETDEDLALRANRPTLAQATLKVGVAEGGKPEAMLALLFEHEHPLSSRQFDRLRAFGQFMGHLFLMQRQTRTFMRQISIQNQEVWLGRVNAMFRHHFKNGLWTINSWLETVEKKDATADEALKGIAEIIKQLSPSTDRNKNFVKDIVSQPVSADHLWNKISSEMSAAANLEKVTIARAPNDLGIFETDPDILGEIFFALVQNAVRHAGANSKVTIQSSDTGLVIADNGKGIGADVKAKLFSPGITTDPSSTGLGLYIAKLMAQALGGDLVHLNSDVGTAFEIRLSRSNL